MTDENEILLLIETKIFQVQLVKYVIAQFNDMFLGIFYCNYDDEGKNVYFFANENVCFAFIVY